MKVALAVLSVLAVASVAPAQLCANYEFRSNPSDFGVQGTVADTIAVWNTLSTQSGVVPTNNFDSITDGANGGNGQNYAARFQLNFILPAPLQVDFYAGIDFGLGGYLSLDGTITDLRSYDLWWNYDITNSAQVLHVGALLSAGPHSLDVLGFEGCCGGANSIYFSTNKGPLSIVTCDAFSTDGLLISSPQWYANTPAIVTSDDSSVTVSLATDEAATTNCIVVGASQPAPTRGQIGSLDWYGSSASGRVSTNQTAVQLTLSGLLCGVTYDVYCSATGTAGDLMADADVYGNVLTFTTTGAGCFDAACAGPNPSGSCSTVVNSNTKFVSLSFSKPEHYHNAQNSCA